MDVDLCPEDYPERYSDRLSLYGHEHQNEEILHLPKSKRLGCITQKELQNIMDRLNHRPRKSFGFKTPYELFFKKKTLLTIALAS